MTRFLIASFRFTLLIIFAGISLVVILPLVPLISKSKLAYITRIWAKINAKINGMHLETSGIRHEYMSKNTVVVANHFSWLDVIVLYSIYFINFVGKREMRRWPILNWLIMAGGTIFVDRSNKREILKTNHLISNELTKGRCIGLFPEGGVNNGNRLLPFKSPLLEAAIAAKSTIIPIVIIYYHKDGRVAYNMSYSKQNLWQNVSNTLLLNGFITKVIELDSINAGDFESRHQLSSYLYNKMSEVYEKRSKLRLTDESI